MERSSGSQGQVAKFMFGSVVLKAEKKYTDMYEKYEYAIKPRSIMQNKETKF